MMRSLRSMAWNEVVAKAIAAMPGNVPVECYQRRIEAGEVALIGCFYGDDLQIAIVAGWRNWTGELEWVLELAVQLCPHENRFPDFMPMLEDYAARKGAAEIVVHTQRKGMVKRLEGFGFGDAETVMKKGLSNG